ncbi:MAG: HTH-type transcriptional repressor KstR2 [Candidatus Ordinivivax streblomastigis]|uniref:HTH-type transcriptional repressor KstR2 n=1 Tax=Candidatus Ordinivivax streblomastigis TaxID=2540710 RepID=A0A5M8P271_9BACT|nr:MAG: HTH-type transcriptional repressor KstR2 [Candidatus Ordinivivax streblomastigis]
MTTDTKSQILQTALKMFLRNSYKDVSLRDIVNEVGLTKGAFYHYYTSKEEVFEEAVKYFYNHVMIADYKDFPRTSLKDFYPAYLEKLQKFDMEDMEDTNFFIFISEAANRIADFLDIHSGQRKKERWAWSEIIGIAKQNKEIKSTLPDNDIAMLFLNLSDGIMYNSTFAKKNEIVTLQELKRDWDNLYRLLANKK